MQYTNAAEVHNLRIDGLKSVSGELRDAFSDEVPVSDDNVYGKVAKHVVYADNAHKAYLVVVILMRKVPKSSYAGLIHY